MTPGTPSRPCSHAAFELCFNQKQLVQFCFIRFNYSQNPAFPNSCE
nr:MAG TPA: hypothetical protein [Bacteriophage sp.]